MDSLEKIHSSINIIYEFFMDFHLEYVIGMDFTVDLMERIPYDGEKVWKDNRLERKFKCPGCRNLEAAQTDLMV